MQLMAQPLGDRPIGRERLLHPRDLVIARLSGTVSLRRIGVAPLRQLVAPGRLASVFLSRVHAGERHPAAPWRIRRRLGGSGGVPGIRWGPIGLGHRHSLQKRFS